MKRSVPIQRFPASSAFPWAYAASPWFFSATSASSNPLDASGLPGFSFIAAENSSRARSNFPFLERGHAARVRLVGGGDGRRRFRGRGRRRGRHGGAAGGRRGGRGRRGRLERPGAGAAVSAGSGACRQAQPEDDRHGEGEQQRERRAKPDPQSAMLLSTWPRPSGGAPGSSSRTRRPGRGRTASRGSAGSPRALPRSPGPAGKACPSSWRRRRPRGR